MHRFSKTLFIGFIGACMALSGMSPLALAAPAASHPAKPAVSHCFTEDMVPGDDSSSLMVCVANAPATTIQLQ